MNPGEAATPHPRQMVVCMVYNWEKRIKKFVEPSEVKGLELTEGDHVYRLVLDLGTRPTGNEITTLFTDPMEENETAPRKPGEQSMESWLAEHIFYQSIRIVPPGSFSPEKPMEAGWSEDGTVRISLSDGTNKTWYDISVKKQPQ